MNNTETPNTNTIVNDVEIKSRRTIEIVNRGLAKRKAAERRFRFYGKLAIFMHFADLLNWTQNSSFSFCPHTCRLMLSHVEDVFMCDYILGLVCIQMFMEEIDVTVCTSVENAIFVCQI